MSCLAVAAEGVVAVSCLSYRVCCPETVCLLLGVGVGRLDCIALGNDVRITRGDVPTYKLLPVSPLVM